jgi:hypothetical protein
VSFLMCPFCVRGQLTTETTSSLSDHVKPVPDASGSLLRFRAPSHLQVAHQTGRSAAPARCQTHAWMWPVVWMLPFLAATGLALAVVVGVRGETWPRSAAFLYLALLGGSALALTLYVASEDDYRRGGISRWHAYDAQELTVAAIATALAAAAALISAAKRRRAGLAIIGFLASSAAFALCFAAFLANSLN